MKSNTVLQGRNDFEHAPSPATINRILRAPFGREHLRFRHIDRDWIPYFEGDDLLDRLIEATNNTYDLVMGDWQWKDQQVFCFGHLEIPGLGRRAGAGHMQHTSNSGKDMGAALMRGLATNMMKDCLIRFGCGDQVRRMEPMHVDPDNPRNSAEIHRWLDRWFPVGDVDQAVTSPPIPLSSRKGEQEGAPARSPSTTDTDLRCEGCPTILTPGLATYSERNFEGRRLCNNCQKKAANG